MFGRRGRAHSPRCPLRLSGATEREWQEGFLGRATAGLCGLGPGAGPTCRPTTRTPRRLRGPRPQTMAAALLPCNSPMATGRSLMDPRMRLGRRPAARPSSPSVCSGASTTACWSGTATPSAALRGWTHLSTVALQADGRVGYVQPIGDRAIPGQVVDRNSTRTSGSAPSCWRRPR